MCVCECIHFNTQTNEQHSLAQCDTCHLYLHIGCLNPPLSHLPARSEHWGWECSECFMGSLTTDKETSAIVCICFGCCCCCHVCVLNYTIVMFQISAAAVAPDAACGQLCERAEETQEVLYIYFYKSSMPYCLL